MNRITVCYSVCEGGGGGGGGVVVVHKGGELQEEVVSYPRLDA